jgi:hypothetical protein
MRFADVNISVSSFFVSPMTDFDPSKIEEEILQNEELVKQILESAENYSAPMTLSGFRNWLKTSLDSGESEQETGAGTDQASSGNALSQAIRAISCDGLGRQGK